MTGQAARRDSVSSAVLNRRLWRLAGLGSPPTLLAVRRPAAGEVAAEREPCLWSSRYS
jgi:hypothetical protein